MHVLLMQVVSDLSITMSLDLKSTDWNPSSAGLNTKGVVCLVMGEGRVGSRVRFCNL